MWWLVVGAFLLGLAAFLLVIRGRSDDGFFRADGVPAASGDRYPDLPAPLPAGEDGSVIGPLDPPPIAEATPQPVIEREPVPAPAPPPPPRAEPVEKPREDATATRKARPMPGQTPPPDYPARALARGEGGKVLVIAHIGPDGVPTAVQLAQASGSRDLDRAAMQAVRRWRFEPAMESGRPTVGQVLIPIDFQPQD